MTATGVLANVIAAHGFAGSSWLHPLTGWDHVLAMVAVGGWSAQLGGRSLWLVPTGFLAAMGVGATAGLLGLHVPGGEVAIAGSVVLLGVALALRLRVTTTAAAAAVALFGLCHGAMHGLEYTNTDGSAVYLVGILITTSALHLTGAAAALLNLDSDGEGRGLRVAGGAAAAVGAWLLVSAM